MLWFNAFRAEMQEDLDALLSQCDYIAKKLKSDVQRLINGKKSRDLIRQPEIINEKFASLLCVLNFH